MPVCQALGLEELVSNITRRVDCVTGRERFQLLLVKIKHTDKQKSDQVALAGFSSINRYHWKCFAQYHMYTYKYMYIYIPVSRDLCS